MTRLIDGLLGLADAQTIPFGMVGGESTTKRNALDEANDRQSADGLIERIRTLIPKNGVSSGRGLPMIRSISRETGRALGPKIPLRPRMENRRR
jgi:hypothetical protein